MSRLTDLIAQAKAKDSQLGADLDREFKALSSRLPFGLNFERHSPEAVELPLRAIRKGDKVRVLPVRGSTKKGDQRLWQVKAINKAKKLADLELLGTDELETQSVALEDLVVVAEFRDTIYPGLVSTGKVEHGVDKPFHTVINGENYHVLKALTYTHRGKVDAIYIDPPYNTGAKDWKYNNDYVEGDDLYRHSKWLAMMERRLLVAKELLNPADSVLIVTIDEKEYLRLGLLLEQTFQDASIQMITSMINTKGSTRTGKFCRRDEYIYVTYFGKAAVNKSHDDMISSAGKSGSVKTIWNSLLRRGADGSSRQENPNLFYPIWVDPSIGKIVDVGAPISPDTDRNTVVAPSHRVIPVWPIRSDASEGRWQLSSTNLQDMVLRGFAKLGAYNRKKDQYAVVYLKRGQLKDLESGSLLQTGSAPDGSGIFMYQEDAVTTSEPGSIWVRDSHDASTYGTNLIREILPGRKFPYPKSLYAVEDALRFFVKEKSNAIILDFFSGSGTTAHAVMRLNRQDDGRRQCISVTNNEVAAAEQMSLREQGLRPGDPEWETHGICDSITKPRVAAAITGTTPEGKPIKGDYKFIDEFQMAEGFEENAEFFTLTYEAKDAVNHNLAYARIAPLLWLRAGARGNRIDKLPPEGWAVSDTYGLLAEVDKATSFIKAVNEAEKIHVAYIVTDDDRRFQSIAKRLPDGVEPVRLYESYLTNFSFANGE